MSFSNVLREVLEQDDGLVLRLSTYQGMMASQSQARGDSEGLWGRMRARSRMILAAVGAFGARRNEKEEE